MIKKLLENFIPENYKLNLNINAEDSVFSGNVEIQGELTQNTDTIELHSKELVILEASINGIKAKSTSLGEFDVLNIESTEPIDAGPIKLLIEFQGRITDAMHGVYPCYFEHKGKKKKLIATQFESHHAREVFPCIDEPAAKSTFDLTLVTNDGQEVLSNTPVKSQTTDEGKLTTTFKTTPLMSTYLLAFVTGEMHYKEAKTKEGIIVRSWTTVAQDVNWLDFSLNEAVDCLDFYIDYFKVPYPLEKYDQVALPDFESAAMENWGLITFREVVLLSDPKNPSLSGKQLISEVIAHELSHQWFGNLVTMQWWDDLWLNESFANMISYLAMDKLHPEWTVWEEYISHDAVASTNRDVYSDVQSVRVSVNDPSEISSLFDPYIVYAKGGKLLKGLLDLLGEETWRAGLKDYFTKHAYKNTTKDDLWTAFSAHSDLDIGSFINPWLEHSGQPLVSVNQVGTSATLSQQRFTLDDSDDDFVWPVPLLSSNAPAVLKKQKEQITLKDTAPLQLNSTGFGHYITNYLDTEHKETINSLISSPDQTSLWKITRLNELLMLAKHGDSSLAEALGAIENAHNEQRAMVWTGIASILGNARVATDGNKTAEKILKQMTVDLAQANFAELGWDYQDTDNSNTTHLRSITLSLMAAGEDKDVIEYALKLYRSVKYPDQLPAEIRSLILALVVKFGTEAEFSELVENYKSTTVADYQTDVCAALTSTKKTEQITELHKLMLNNEIVRSQDLRQWFVYLMRNKHARDQTWQWLEDSWPWIMETFKGSKSYDDFARYSASFLSTPEMLEKYTTFFADKKHDTSLKRAIAIGTEEIKARVAWRARDESKIATWLKQYSAKNS